MPKKLTLTEDQIKNFCIDTVKDFEGCPEALIFLKKIHKDTVQDLRNTRREFMDLINVDKGIWITNFLMNLLVKEHRIEFYEEVLIKEIRNLASEMLNIDITENIVGASYYEEVDKLLVKAIHAHYEDHNNNGTFTRSISRSIGFIAEAKASHSIQHKQYEPNCYQQMVKKLSTKALDFTGVFRNAG